MSGTIVCAEKRWLNRYGERFNVNHFGDCGRREKTSLPITFRTGSGRLLSGSSIGPQQHARADPRHRQHFEIDELLEILGCLVLMFDGEPACEVRTGETYLTEPEPHDETSRKAHGNIAVAGRRQLLAERSGWPEIEGCDPYFTSFSTGGKRRWLLCAPSGGASFCVMASHKAFNSASPIRLSFIRSWRIASESSCAVSGSALTSSAALHFSSAARTECDRRSELDTSVFP
ncbi:MAG: hypothetical protein KGK01_00940 [Bradyrhizobium sp.]|uniref:hypothetical protein n=1 Tax=Bradyrhizobium sp. TaxID=376 RepID=UPI001C29972F|nr:hypothetical protein [Bradyrhizobium sp.]MBU6461750.1 hypothetical protein [Pseudomonadota bacterium]MDE2067997.1 hypothetical protein [Bradyrhizobium sp.]MDE2241036.1 hypothetical protein [Bradyrhizobium sp.]